MVEDRKTTRLDPASFDSDLQRILAVLFNSKICNQLDWLSAIELSHAFRDEYGIRLHWRTIDAVLSRERKAVDRRKRQKRTQYMILTPGIELITLSRKSVLLIDPTKAVQAVMTLHQFLATMVGTTMICDPYLDNVTIEHLDSCPKGNKLMVLTKNISDSGKLRRILSASCTAGHDIEIRVPSGNTLHDRYIVDVKNLLILGTSINGFGKKQSFVIQISGDIRQAVLDAFQKAWSGGTVWP